MRAPAMPYAFENVRARTARGRRRARRDRAAVDEIRIRFVEHNSVSSGRPRCTPRTASRRAERPARVVGIGQVHDLRVQLVRRAGERRRARRDRPRRSGTVVMRPPWPTRDRRTSDTCRATRARRRRAPRNVRTTSPSSSSMPEVTTMFSRGAAVPSRERRAQIGRFGIAVPCGTLQPRRIAASAAGDGAEGALVRAEAQQRERGPPCARVPPARRTASSPGAPRCALPARVLRSPAHP